MYIGKHHGTLDKGSDNEEPIHIPENYAGNAFSPRHAETKTIEEAACKETCVAEAPPSLAKETRKSGSYLKAENIFSTDTLLVLLAILLFGNDESGELPIILLLLLLF